MGRRIALLVLLVAAIACGPSEAAPGPPAAPSGAASGATVGGVTTSSDAIATSSRITPLTTRSAAAPHAAALISRPGHWWVLKEFVAAGLHHTLLSDEWATLTLSPSGSSTLRAACGWRTGTWSGSSTQLLLGDQQDVLASCGVEPSLQSTFVADLLFAVSGRLPVTATGTASHRSMRLTSGSSSFTFQDQLSGSDAHPSPRVPAPDLMVGVHWLLTSVTTAGSTVNVVPSADLWLELLGNGRSTVKDTACDPREGPWQRTDDGFVAEEFAPSRWTCPRGGLPTMTVFGTDRHTLAYPLVDLAATVWGGTLTLRRGDQVVRFTAHGPTISDRPVHHPQIRPWIPVPPAQLQGADRALISTHWVLVAVESQGVRTTFDPTNAVDLDLYADGSAALTDLCRDDLKAWRPARNGFRLQDERGVVVRCAAAPPPEVAKVGWPAVSALGGGVAATVSGRMLTLHDHSRILTFSGTPN